MVIRESTRGRLVLLGLLLVLNSVPALAAADGIALTVSRGGDAGEVLLDWSGEIRVD